MVEPVESSGSKLPWLLILVVVVVGGLGFLSIIAAIAIPGLLASQRASNERNASSTLRTFASAEADFRANDRDGNREQDFWVGDVRSLYTIKAGGAEIRLIEPAAAKADDAALDGVAPEPKAGYLFRALQADGDGKKYDLGKGRNPSEFGFDAHPAKVGASGKQTYLINENNRVIKIPGGQPRTSFPSDAEAKALGAQRLE